jgi:putative tricarboxylic transport membrane protein
MTMPILMGLVLLGLGLFVIIQGIELGVGRPSQPGPGFVPLGLGSILTLLAILYLQSGRRKGKDGGKGDASSVSYGRTALGFTALILYALLLQDLGYLPTTFLLFCFWLFLIERKRWTVAIPLGFLAVVGVYFFNVLFSVQLPAGILKGMIR